MKVIGINFMVFVVLISGCVHINNKSVGSSAYLDPPSQPLPGCGIDSKEYSGFAFGMGIDRIALLLHQISDIRLLSENDVRFLEQFKSTL